jgi:hypothetical protein
MNVLHVHIPPHTRGDQGKRVTAIYWELVHIGEVTRTWPGSASGAGGSVLPSGSAPAGWAVSKCFLSAYEAAAGATIDREAFRWWLTLATLRWGVICRFQAERHLSGQSPSVELAAIGRRVSETEWDVLDLLDGGQEHDVRAATDGQVNFHARVAANVLRIVERELGASAGDVPDALADLGYADEAQLSAAIRAGELDDRSGDVLSCLRTLVRHRLAVAHPGYDQT